MATIDDTLAAIDAGQGAALERLFALLSIPSISAVPAHFPDCERAADWLAAELGALGFAASKRQTPPYQPSSIATLTSLSRRLVVQRRRFCGR